MRRRGRLRGRRVEWSWRWGTRAKSHRLLFLTFADVVNDSLPCLLREVGSEVFKLASAASEGESAVALLCFRRCLFAFYVRDELPILLALGGIEAVEKVADVFSADFPHGWTTVSVSFKGHSRGIEAVGDEIRDGVGRVSTIRCGRNGPDGDASAIHPDLDGTEELRRSSSGRSCGRGR